MALSDKRILAEMKRGNIIIHPFKERNLATSSYDVCLGEYYYREREPKPHEPFLDIWSKKKTEETWGESFRAEEAKYHLPENLLREGIRPNDRVILLRPGEMILAHTEEFIGGRNIITSMMKARSSLGRQFIAVCKCAGWGDVGYVNRWTMEITNHSRYYTIPLVVGRRIAQIVFFETGAIRGNDYTKNGKYLSTSDTGKMVKEWSVKMMLPRLYNDHEIR